MTTLGSKLCPIAPSTMSFKGTLGDYNSYVSYCSASSSTPGTWTTATTFAEYTPDVVGVATAYASSTSANITTGPNVFGATDKSLAQFLDNTGHSLLFGTLTQSSPLSTCSYTTTVLTAGDTSYTNTAANFVMTTLYSDAECGTPVSLDENVSRIAVVSGFSNATGTTWAAPTTNMALFNALQASSLLPTYNVIDASYTMYMYPALNSASFAQMSSGTAPVLQCSLPSLVAEDAVPETVVMYVKSNATDAVCTAAYQITPILNTTADFANALYLSENNLASAAYEILTTGVATSIANDDWITVVS